MAYQLLFVCLGNICRSPSAENIMRYLLETEGLTNEIICDSAGTSDYHIGSPPDRRMTIAAETRGIKLKGRARQFHPNDFEKYDLILAMDRDNYWSLISLDPHKKYRDKIQMMCDYARNYQDTEVPDPYYGGTEGFNYVIDLLLDACGGLLAEIRNNPQ
ncbi:protein tyrosine phosphatase [Halothece sp. PCC 7418]|uniref:low molecular weight protein-tyrosine-phosphatase n=1 Tax=Halothece sp. (strain PCC 7418) TaxID=65093 RepID=UPI0002A07463|nr:low molecular weight protein-tyrosine-phosphatase [Halothece sp. PCC 7418]AFZ44381.1 protein tyrosine phosphatase [Halothece sp. PCC 7418]